MFKSNVVVAAVVGLILGVVAEVLFALVGRIPILNCLLAPLAFLLGLGLPMLIGAIAAASGQSRGWLTTPAGALDGALAALLAELISRLIGFCVSLFAARGFFFGPRFLMPSVGPITQALFSGVWAIGWLVVSLSVAALLGALGGFLYNAFSRKPSPAR